MRGNLDNLIQWWKSLAHGSHGGTTALGLRLMEIVILTSLGLFLYGDSVTLPFFFDDPLQLRWARNTPLLGLWTGAAGLGYYRPLTSTVWRLSLWLTGTFHAGLLHAVNVALHILNAVLVVTLARQITPGPHQRLTGFVAGILFLFYPFSYQAVPWISALAHPLMTSLLLITVLTAIRAQATSRWGWRALSLGMAITSFFAHESGIVIGGWLLVYDLTHRSGGTHRRISLWPLAYLALGVTYVPLYYSLPRTSSPFSPLTAERLTQSGAYLLQGLAFPIAPLARWTMRNWGWSDLRAAYLAAGLTMGLLVFLSWRRGMLKTLIFALGCFTLSVVPVWLVLPFGYLINGPRVLYLGSVGATIAWACGLQALAGLGRGRWHTLTTALSCFLVGVTVAFGCTFVRTRQAIYHLGGDLIWQVSQVTAATPTGQKLLVVNYPAWLAPDPLVYPIGHEGVEFMPAYIGVGDLAWANSEVTRKIKTAEFANILVPLPGLYYGVRGPRVGWEDLAERMRAADQVYIVHLTAERLALMKAGTLAETAPTRTIPLAIFDDRVILAAAQVTPSDDHVLAVRLVWRAQEPLTDADYRIFVHLYDEAGALIAQSDGYALDGLYPFWLWRHGEQIEEMRYLRWPDFSLSDSYRIAVGIYDGGGGTRLPAFTPDGAHFADDAVPISGVHPPEG